MKNYGYKNCAILWRNVYEKYQKTKHHTLLNSVRKESEHMKKDWKHTPQNDEMLLLEK